MPHLLPALEFRTGELVRKHYMRKQRQVFKAKLRDFHVLTNTLPVRVVFHFEGREDITIPYSVKSNSVWGRFVGGMLSQGFSKHSLLTDYVDTTFTVEGPPWVVLSVEV